MDKEERKEKKRKKKERERGANKGEGGESDREREREREREMGERNKKGDFPSILTIEPRQSESKSRSTHHELRVDTKIMEFRQNP